MTLIEKPIKSEKIRCAKCNIKLNITTSIECKCGQKLCYQHRYFNEHDCNIDYKERERKILEKNNQKVVADKIIMI
jgi:predicted nucleic acid binding AN1-type Zn finger protein